MPNPRGLDKKIKMVPYHLEVTGVLEMSSKALSIERDGESLE